MSFTEDPALAQVYDPRVMRLIETVSAHKFSAGAQAKIEKAGGRCEVIPR